MALATSQSLIYLLLEAIGAMQRESNCQGYVLYLATSKESEETCAYSS